MDFKFMDESVMPKSCGNWKKDTNGRRPPANFNKNTGTSVIIVVALS